MVDHLGVVQLDSVNVFARSHYLPFFARLGAYDTRSLDRYAWGSGALFECLAHEASIAPVERYPLLRHLTTRGWRAARWHRRLRESPEFAALAQTVLQRVRDEGPIAISDIEGGASIGPWWGWTDGKRALEALFSIGELAVASRRNFSRVYDLPERVFPRAILDAPPLSEEDGQRELLRLAVRHHGIGTARDLADYYRQFPFTPTKRRLRELVDAGAVLPVTVEGWDEPAYLDPDAAIPRRVEARALLSPFDPVVWERARAERLFDFVYRIEIYTPEPKRVFGYYVLPFLLGDRLVARVDLKADRQTKVLVVRAAHLEAGVSEAEVAAALAEELGVAAEWLGLDEVRVEAKGDLAPALGRASRSMAAGAR